ncbi:MAG TPA: hypothetical protein VHW47_08560 [Acidimicrobiales bacterium]|nr:hypothetical protein [Acidimicrobiales bacterium]
MSAAGYSVAAGRRNRSSTAEHPERAGRLASLECVVNVSEGRAGDRLEQLATACGEVLLDLHRDPDHHRSVLTLGGPGQLVEEAARALTATAVASLDLTGHDGRHPRIGVVDVVPFVPLDRSPSGGSAPVDLSPAVAARGRFARWAAAELGLPCFLYGPLPDGTVRSLPEVRKRAFAGLVPDRGPTAAHPTAGACAVGARPVLVAYNLWLAGGDLGLARSVGAAIRGPAVRALGLELSGAVQVSCNLIDPLQVGPAQVYDVVTGMLEGSGVGVDRTELVGLLPEAALQAVPAGRWEQLDLRPETTIEARLSRRGFRPG